MKKSILKLALLSVSLSLCSCNSSVEETSTLNNDTEKESLTNMSELESVTISVDDNLIEEDFLELADFSVEVGDRYYIGDELKVANGIEIQIENESIAKFENNSIIGLKEGKTALVAILNNYYCVTNIEVVAKHTLDTSFKIDRHNLYSKKMVVFGDSVSAQATIGTGITYSTRMLNDFEMSSVVNRAIGGTTLTYGYLGSNIYKEYGNSSTILDGCRNVKQAIEEKIIDDCDYVIIAYGHNDQYFQPPIDSEDSVEGLSLANCVSYKASFRYIIESLKQVNENIKIIVLNCTYSEYDKTMEKRYGYENTYEDYRNASHEIAIQYGLRYLDPWDYLKPYFGTNYYKDSVHLTEKGHELLYKFIIEN